MVPFKAICLTVFSIMLMLSPASALEVCGQLQQGELLLIKDINGKQIHWQNKQYPIINGEILIAVPRDAPKVINLINEAGMLYQLPIKRAKWDIQQVKGVAEHHVTPSKQHQQEIAREQQDVRKALTIVSSDEFWRKGFVEPVKGQISGQFGNQRVFNGVPKNPHNGTDIAAQEATPVKAAGNGKVVLSGKNYFYTGNMVIIDHGQGLQTIYAHLQKATVKKGDAVQKGDIIGYVGHTGRAVGAHLHWGASWRGIRFRPHALLDINHAPCHKIEGKYIGE